MSDRCGLRDILNVITLQVEPLGYEEGNGMTNHIFESLGQAWIFGLREIMENGHGADDEYVNIRDISLDESRVLIERYKSQSDNTKLHLKLKEIYNYSITIEHPDIDDPIIKEFADQDRVNYTRQRYGRECGEGGYGIFIYGENGRNVDLIVERLYQNPSSKSATISSPNSWSGNNGKPPCLTAINFLIRNSKLQMFVMYRSQNVYTKQPGNILALYDLQKEVARRLGLPVGVVNLFVCSAHIYESDWEKAREIVSKYQ